jgi:hypothetical protein
MDTSTTLYIVNGIEIIMSCVAIVARKNFLPIFCWFSSRVFKTQQYIQDVETYAIACGLTEIDKKDKTQRFMYTAIHGVLFKLSLEPAVEPKY